MSELKAIESATAVIENVHLVYRKSEADKVIAELKKEIEEQAKEIKFMHQHCSHGERCGTSCAQIHGELMQATIEIAELKAREDVLVTDNRNLLDKVKKLENHLRENAEHFKRNEAQILENAENELRRHKHKRCLAMAEKCDARYYEEDAKVNGHAASWEYISKEMKYWERWRNRWLAIAEKFKEYK